MMKQKIIKGIGIIVVCVCAVSTGIAGGMGVYDFTMTMNNGEEKPLADYTGRTLLIVNTASHCGYTGQYAGLESLYQRYKDRGLMVLAFPANNFLGQEPGTDAEIKTFCDVRYHVTFDLFSKISVKGGDIHPLYSYLTTCPGFEGDITWNFNKFLVDKTGAVVARFPTKMDPLDPTVLKKIEEIL
jgi:glutathione peroxidase